jgi:hypothetical protein
MLRQMRKYVLFSYFYAQPNIRSFHNLLQDIADPTEYPGIYIKVGSYLEWISAVFNADARKNLTT